MDYLDQPFRSTINCTLILQEGHQIAFALHHASLWYFAFKASVPGKQQSMAFLFHAQIKREKIICSPQHPAPIPAVSIFPNIFIII